MRDLNKIINTILVTVSGIVALIFAVGLFKKNVQVEKTDQSSFREVNTDDLTNKYIKELQIKLKQNEIDSLAQVKKTQIPKPVEKTKDEDWSKVPLEQQISREGVSTRNAAGSVSGGTVINKENAAEFIATARKNGYHVVLSPNYEVISITPLLNTQNLDDSFETHPAQ